MRARGITVSGFPSLRAGLQTGFVVCLVLAAALRSVAQVEESAMFGGDFLENIIVERDLALRLRAAVQLTEDDDELIEDDIEYAAYPSRLYSTEARLFHNSRSTMSARWALWQNDQDLNMRRWTVKARRPLTSSLTDGASYLTLKASFREGVDASDDRTSLYLGVDRSIGDEFYAYLQYRHRSEDGESPTGQLYQYVSWRPTSRFRFGEQAAMSRREGGENGPWYVQLFTTVFLVKDTTALRFTVQHYDSSGRRKYQEYNAYAYQRLGTRSLLRLNYRLYDDNQGLSSHAYGAKLKRYFTERMDAHLGYRYYDHSEGADFDTVYAGLGVLL